jgi:hypothetical protein
MPTKKYVLKGAINPNKPVGKPGEVVIPSDTDPFPFGTHKGTKYEDVPASYLIWFADQVWAPKWAAPYAYVTKHRKVLELEIKQEKQSRRRYDD